jgi:inositol transport system substrate-binding protein
MLPMRSARVWRTACSLLLCCAVGMAWGQERPVADKTVLLSLSKASEPFMATLRTEAEDEAAKLGLRLVFQDGKGDSAVQSAGVEAAVASGQVDALLIAPNDVHALVPAVNLALARGMPVVTVDRQVVGTRQPVPHVGVDNVFGGRLLAQWVLARFPDGARVLHLTGQPGSSTAIDRARGVRDAFAAAGPRYPLVADISANWSRAEALMVTEGQLTFLPQPPDVVLAANDDMAIGALEAIARAGMAGRGIQVLGYDALPAARQLLREGRLAATVDQHAGQQSRIALRHLARWLRKGTPADTVVLQPMLVTP